MNVEKTRILVVGAGAIGGITAAFLARAGGNVGVVDKNPAILGRVRAEGLHVFGAGGEFRAFPRVYAGIEEVPGRVDVVFLATKSTTLPAAAEALKPALAAGARVVSLQNGVCAEAVAGVLGVDSTVGCVIGWGATMHAPAELEMTSKGGFVVGRLDGRVDDALRLVREVLSVARPAEISTNIMGHIYAKLIINSCITTLGAVSGLLLGKMLASERTRVVCIGIIREAMDVAAVLRLKVEPVSGLDFCSFLAGGGIAGNLKRHAVIRLIGFKYRRLKSSSLQSLERGERSEVDVLNGYISRKGREFRLPTPLNDRLVAMVKEIEAGTRRISPANLAEL